MFISGGNKILLVGFISFILNHFHSIKWERPLPGPEHSCEGRTPCTEGHMPYAGHHSECSCPCFPALRPGVWGSVAVWLSVDRPCTSKYGRGAEATTQPTCPQQFPRLHHHSVCLRGPWLQSPTPASDNSLLQTIRVEALPTLSSELTCTGHFLGTRPYQVPCRHPTIAGPFQISSHRTGFLGATPIHALALRGPFPTGSSRGWLLPCRF